MVLLSVGTTIHVLFNSSFSIKMIKDDNFSGAGLDCLRDWTNNVQSSIPIYVAERDYEVGSLLLPTPSYWSLLRMKTRPNLWIIT